MEKYSVSFASHFSLIFPGLFILIIYSAGSIYFYFNYDFEIFLLTLRFIAAIVFFQLLIQLLIHLRYWRANRGAELVFDKIKNEITFSQNGKTVKFGLNEIHEISTNFSVAKFQHMPGLFPWDRYIYSIIYLENGKSFLVTSLLLPDLFWPISMPKENIHKRLFCWPNEQEIRING